MNQDLLTDRQGQTEKIKRHANLFFCLAIVFGLMMLFLEPPFVCPDEGAHYVNIVRMARGNLFADVEDGVAGSYMTAEEQYFLLAYGGLYNGENGETFTLEKASELSSVAVSEEMVFFPSDHAKMNPVPYLLPALAIFLLRLLSFELNGYNLLLVAKICNLLFYAAIIRLALLKTGALRNTMFLLALMPMALFQGASASYDAYQIPAAMLLFAYITKILTSNEDYRVTRTDLVAVTFASALTVNCKIAYAPLLLLLLAIPPKKFGPWKRYFKYVGVVVGVVSISYLVPTLITNHITSGTTPTVLEATQQHQALFWQNPWIFFDVIKDTVTQFGPFWGESFFGILGWLDTRFPKSFVGIFFLILGISAITEASQLKGIRWRTRLLSLTGPVVVFLGTLFFMYYTWNPFIGIVGGTLAHGVQGRYFIPLALFIILSLANPLLAQRTEEGRLSCAIANFRERLVSLTAVSYLAITVLTLLVRYWV